MEIFYSNLSKAYPSLDRLLNSSMVKTGKERVFLDHKLTRSRYKEGFTHTITFVHSIFPIAESILFFLQFCWFKELAFSSKSIFFLV